MNTKARTIHPILITGASSGIGFALADLLIHQETNHLIITGRNPEKLQAAKIRLEAIGQYWISSLQDLLEISGVNPSAVKHYIAHQVDASKNAAIAEHCDINPISVAKCFSEYGNMGSPTIFVNFHNWVNQPNHQFKSGDNLVFHAVGGGVSWAGICLELTD